MQQKIFEESDDSVVNEWLLTKHILLINYRELTSLCIGIEINRYVMDYV